RFLSRQTIAATLLLRTTIFFLGSCAASLTCAQDSGAARADNVDSYVLQAMHEQKIPGLALAVVRDGKIVKEKGYGLADIEWNAPVTPQTVFESGSIGK